MHSLTYYNAVATRVTFREYEKGDKLKAELNQHARINAKTERIVCWSGTSHSMGACGNENENGWHQLKLNVNFCTILQNYSKCLYLYLTCIESDNGGIVLCETMLEALQSTKMLVEYTKIDERVQILGVTFK